ncbi:hypothetical protein [Micavibrio aeruginosavorus]|uniref:Uncharacterized protein n=1 Tax=Micavibrio aeruginosavorus EPB TaxID=349215 RepID=M4VZB7_9BACT|nr:hypothetical protein [Micavibrio aeruginosavorus]AGH98514.1 hypothetical protein A11S_1712 [Micavibrio aeruginosavorus EPB]
MAAWIACAVAVLTLTCVWVILGEQNNKNHRIQSEGIPFIDESRFSRYPAGVRTFIVRMMISGVAVEDIRFNSPDELGALVHQRDGVFSPDGGGAQYKKAFPHVMEAQKEGDWYFNMNIAWPGIGSNQADLVAYLPGVTQKICALENIGSDIEGVPELEQDISAFYKFNIVDFPSAPHVPPKEPLARVAQETLAGHLFGCFRDKSLGQYTYYHVLVER